MILYSQTKRGFIDDCNNENVVNVLEQLFLDNHMSFSKSEKNSWKDTAKYLKDILIRCNCDDDICVYLEYMVPLMSKRVDVMLAGTDDEGNKNVIIIEMKQWDKCCRTGRDNVVEAFTGGKKQEVTHPSYQAFSYCEWIKAFTKAIVDENINLIPCAVLHNYDVNKIDELECEFYSDVINKAPIFIKEREDDLINFIQQKVKNKPSNDIVQLIEDSDLVPSQSLQDSLVSMMNGNSVFTLIESQKVVFEKVINTIQGLDFSGDRKQIKKTVFICKGGPGTGKSVVAIKLLSELIVSMGKVACYVTKNAAPRKIMIKELKEAIGTHQCDTLSRQDQVDELFKGSASFQPTTRNTMSDLTNRYDCIIVDESHRLEEVRRTNQRDVNHIKSIINSSIVSIFFIDENQRVTVYDKGTVEEIKRFANEYEANVIEGEDYNLVSQFRCGGSDGYLAFLDNILYNNNSIQYEINHNYQIKIYNSPTKMKRALWEKNQEGNKTRIVAGYCYNWVTQNEESKRRFQDKYHIPESEYNTDIRLKYDIFLEDGFKSKWNLGNTSTWAIDPSSFEEVGCIHTCQGLEFEYCGVIIGKDLRYENNKIITDQSKIALTDYTSGIRTCSDAVLADELIKNTYRTLLSRGQKGCYIYCEDKNLSNYLLSVLHTSYADEEDGLTDSQRKGLRRLLIGDNCFVTGEAGTGKSYLIDYFAEVVSVSKKVLRCAPTGLAANSIGGFTIHKCFGIPRSPSVLTRDICASENIIKQIANNDVIIIDEISMCRIDVFEYVLRTINAAEELKGGKIQVVVVGDFFQLPPVITQVEKSIIKSVFGTDEGFAFESSKWNENNFIMIELIDNVRQGNSDSQEKEEFIKYLNNIRVHKDTDETLNYFNSKSRNDRFSNDEVVELHTTNAEVNSYNEECLNRLNGTLYEYDAEFDSSIPEDKYPCENTIKLKIDAKVMLLVNEKCKYKNGSIGIIKRCFNDGVIVDVNNYSHYITKHEFNVLMDPSFDEVTSTILQEEYANSFKQLPLKLAYAITVHKSQGQTFKYVNFNPSGNEIDRLQNGQLYVALSRLKSIDGLYLYNPITINEWKTSSKVLTFYSNNRNHTTSFLKYKLDWFAYVKERVVAFRTVLSRALESLEENHIVVNPQNICAYLKGTINVAKKTAYYSSFGDITLDNVIELYQEFLNS